METNNSISEIFGQSIEILVTENVKQREQLPSIIVSLEFGLMLRVGDVLFFGDKDEEKPKWVQKWDNQAQLFDFAITLTQRNIDHDNKISFFAELG